MIKTLKINKENTVKAVGRGYILATDFADYLVKKGEPFRTAHSIVGRLVSYASEKGKKLSEISLSEFKEFSPLFEEDVIKINIESSLLARNAVGGTSPERVMQELAKARKTLGHE